MKVERRKAVVPLYPGGFESELAEIHNRLLDAIGAEESGATPQRQGTKSKAAAVAREYDAKLAEREAARVEVTLREISNAEWGPLADQHPPKADDAADKANGLNLDTFPAALLRASLASDIDLNDLSRAHYVKLERAAWDLHNQGDELVGKSSAVSLLKRLRDPDSKQPSDSE